MEVGKYFTFLYLIMQANFTERGQTKARLAGELFLTLCDIRLCFAQEKYYCSPW